MIVLDECPICEGTGSILDDPGDPDVWVGRSTRQWATANKPCIYCQGYGRVTSFARTAYFLRYPTNPWWIPKKELEALVLDVGDVHEIAGVGK